MPPLTSKAQIVRAILLASATDTIDLMDALRKSVGGAAAEDKAPKMPTKKAKKAAGQKEMLMPIAGKKPVKETAAKKPAAGARRKSA